MIEFEPGVWIMKSEVESIRSIPDEEENVKLVLTCKSGRTYERVCAHVEANGVVFRVLSA